MQWKHLLLPIVLCLGALACALPSLQLETGPIAAQSTAATGVPTATLGPGPASHLLGSTLRDVEYCAPEGVSVAMDLYFPEQADRAAPAIVFVHGGGWKTGDKSGGAGIAGPQLLLHGYVVASVNYRLAPGYPFPAQIEDVKCAVRFLRAHAAEFGIDPQRIGAYGSSAGGHLVSLLGLAGPEADLEGNGGWQDQSSTVQAVVNLYGPNDLAKLCTEAASGVRVSFRMVFGATDCLDPVVLRASPVTYVHAGAPPFLVIQGTEDTLVPASQAKTLSDRLEVAGVPVSLLLVEHAGHGFKPVDGDPDPSRVEIARRIVEFFDSVLK